MAQKTKSSVYFSTFPHIHSFPCENRIGSQLAYFFEITYWILNFLTVITKLQSHSAQSPYPLVCKIAWDAASQLEFIDRVTPRWQRQTLPLQYGKANWSIEQRLGWTWLLLCGYVSLKMYCTWSCNANSLTSMLSWILGFDFGFLAGGSSRGKSSTLKTQLF